MTAFFQGWRGLVPLPDGHLLLLAGTQNDAGLRASLDLGQTWTHITNDLPAGSIAPTVLRTAQGLRIPVRQGALLLSVDGSGLPVTALPIDPRMCAADGLGPFVAWCTNPNDNALLAVGPLAGAMRSTDGGVTWRGMAAPIALPTAIAACRDGSVLMASGRVVLWLDHADQGRDAFTLDYQDALLAQALNPILPSPP